MPQSSRHFGLSAMLRQQSCIDILMRSARSAAKVEVEHLECSEM